MSDLSPAAPSSSYIVRKTPSNLNCANRNLFVESLHKKNEKQLTKLSATLEDTLRFNNCASAQLRAALTPAQYADWSAELAAPESADELLIKHKLPAELQDYGRMVGKADFLFGKAEKMAAMKQLHGYKFHSETINRAYQTAETAYEQALERLQEILSQHTVANDLQIWLDRDVSFDFDTELSPEQHGIPRLRTSKSPYVLNPLVRTDKKLKRELVTLRILIQATSEIIYEVNTQDAVTITAANEAKLANLMAKLKGKTSQLD